MKNDEDKYIRKNVLVVKFTPTEEKVIVRRGINGFPSDITQGLNCNYPYQEIDDNDIRMWYVKPFPVSKQYVKRTPSGSFKFFNDILLSS